MHDGSFSVLPHTYSYPAGKTVFLSRKEKNKQQHTIEGNTVALKSERSYLSRRARNQLKHAENGNPRGKKSANDWEVEFETLATWVKKKTTIDGPTDEAMTARRKLLLNGLIMFKAGILLLKDIH